MKIENLKVGATFKNYKELCNFLGIKIKTGKSKQLQHKDFERFFTYEKQGQKYTINQIFNESKDKVDKRGGNNKVFVEDFKKLMIYMLKKNGTECMLLSKGAIYKAMNLVNENYIIARNNIPKLSEIIQLPQSSIYEFYDNNGTRLRETVERNLRICRRESILIFETVTCVAISESMIALNEFHNPIIDENNRLVYKTNLAYREATQEERQLILKYEDEVKQELNFKDNKEIFLKGKWKYFKQQVENKLKINNTNIKFYYDAYRITWNNYKIDDLFKSYCSDDEKDYLESNINKNIINSINRSNKIRHTKASKNNLLGASKNKKTIYQASNEYISEQEQLTFTLINKDAKNLKYEFDNIVISNKLKKSNKLKDEDDQLELLWDIDSLESEAPF